MEEKPIRRIGIVACSKSKLTTEARARDLYQGRLFRLSRAIVEATCDDWVILSAGHGMVLPSKPLAPYDMSIFWMTAQQRREWADEVNADLIKHFGRNVRYVVYAGQPYRAALVGLDFEAPLEGLGIGRQIQQLQRLLRENT
jgi:hypothetical protein